MMVLKSAPRDPPMEDHVKVTDEAMVGIPVDLIEYLERQDNPDPDYHPRVLLAVHHDAQRDEDGLPPAEPRSPPPGTHHEHTVECPFKWNPPSLKVIYRQPGRRNILFQAGILNFIGYNYPKVDEIFLDQGWRDITWSEHLKSIVVAPIVPVSPTQVRESIPRKVLTIAYLQRIWPGLPSTESHLPSDLGVAPSHKDKEFMRQAVSRYFALSLFQNDEGGSSQLVLDPCFHMALYRFLLRLAYIFGWSGYAHTFPAKYFPMAIMTFVSGAHYPWADLLMRELIHDIRRRKPCPRMVRVWKAIWNFVVAEHHNQSPQNLPEPERKYLYVPWLRQCRNEDMAFLRQDLHYHVPEISRWTPRIYSDVLERGSCPIEGCNPKNS